MIWPAYRLPMDAVIDRAELTVTGWVFAAWSIEIQSSFPCLDT
jgi:hypothetical protein